MVKSLLSSCLAITALSGCCKNDPIETLPAVRIAGFTAVESDTVLVERFTKGGNFTARKSGFKVPSVLYDRSDSSRTISYYPGSLENADFRFTIGKTGKVYSVSNVQFASGSFGKCGFNEGADYRYMTGYTINGNDVSGRTIDLIK
jgi:hypothetical protein